MSMSTTGPAEKALENMGLLSPPTEDGAGLHSLYAPGNLGVVQFCLTAGGWASGFEATLSDATETQASIGGVHLTREAAVIAACEAIIEWVSRQKDSPAYLGSRRLRKETLAVQNWALDLARRTADAAAIADFGAGSDAGAGELRMCAAAGQGAAGELRTCAEVIEREHANPIEEPGAEQYLMPQDLGSSSGPTPVQVPIDLLYESPWNPRKHYSEAGLKELAEAMRTGGFWPWTSIMARPITESSAAWLPGRMGGYEVGAGHRRLRAAKMAGLKTLPVTIVALDDDAFSDVLNFDNSGREDVHPLHESAGWEEWLKRPGKSGVRTVQDIAAKIGKSKEYVYGRLKYASLIERGRAMFLDGIIGSRHAELIARQEEKDQHRLLNACEPPAYDRGRRLPYRDLAAIVERDIHVELEGACFDLNDAELVPAAGACAGCRKRTLNAPELIPDPERMAEDLAEAEEDGENFVDAARAEYDNCTDAACFQRKVTAHLVRIKESATKGGVAPIEVRDDYQRSKGKNAPLAREAYEEVKKGTPGAQAAIVAAGSHVGKLLYVKVKAKPDAGSAAKEEERQRREKEKREAEAALEMKVRRAVLNAVRAKVSGFNLEDLRRFVLSALDWNCKLLCDLHGVPCKGEGGKTAFAAAVAKMKEGDLCRVMIELQVKSEFDEWSLRQGREPVALVAAAQQYRVDVAKIRKEIAAGEGGATAQGAGSQPAKKTTSTKVKKAKKR